MICIVEHPSLHHLFAKNRFNNPLPRNDSSSRLGLPTVTNISPIVKRPRFFTQRYYLLGYIPLDLPDAHGTCCVVHSAGALKNRSSHGCILQSPCGPRFPLRRSCCVGRAHVDNLSALSTFPSKFAKPDHEAAFTNVSHFSFPH